MKGVVHNLIRACYFIFPFIYFFHVLKVTDIDFLIILRRLQAQDPYQVKNVQCNSFELIILSLIVMTNICSANIQGKKIDLRGRCTALAAFVLLKARIMPGNFPEYNTQKSRG